MKNEPFDVILVMGSIHRVLKAEKVLMAGGFRVDTLVTPREVSADCGMVIAIEARHLEGAARALAAADVEPVETWKSEGGRFVRLSAAHAGKSADRLPPG